MLERWIQEQQQEQERHEEPPFTGCCGNRHRPTAPHRRFRTAAIQVTALSTLFCLIAWAGPVRADEVQIRSVKKSPKDESPEAKAQRRNLRMTEIEILGRIRETENHVCHSTGATRVITFRTDESTFRRRSWLRSIGSTWTACTSGRRRVQANRESGQAGRVQKTRHILNTVEEGGSRCRYLSLRYFRVAATSCFSFF